MCKQRPKCAKSCYSMKWYDLTPFFETILVVAICCLILFTVAFNWLSKYNHSVPTTWGEPD